jgi:heme A synthase
VAWGNRLVALIALLLVIWLALWAGRFQTARPDLARTDRWAVVLIVAQALAGAFVVFSRLSLASALGHAALMALLFAALADGARRTVPQQRPSEEPRPAGAVVPAPVH